MNEADRYVAGDYDVDFADDIWKAEQMSRLLAHVPDPHTVRSYADVGCGNGAVFAGIRRHLASAAWPIQRAVGYDLLPEDRFTAVDRDLTFKRTAFACDDEAFDLVTVNVVIEHVQAPQEFLRVIGMRARYVALHIPLDDRLSVLLANQYNYRIGPVGHISFFSPASAINLATAAGLLPLCVLFTPGFMAPSGRQRLAQRLAFPFRWLLWRLNPGLMAATVGGASLALLCRGTRQRTV
jgi:SAM-dependent methyltransferase